MSLLINPDFWFTVLRCTTPVLYATLAALIASEAGILNIGMEGAMSVAALTGVLASGYSGSLFIGLIVGLASGIAFTMLLAWFIQHFNADAVITGIALNLAASGGTVFLMYMLTGDKSSSNSVLSLSFPSLKIPVISDITIVGSVLSGHNVLTYCAFIFAIIIAVVLKKTVFGIHLRSVGENEDAARSVGINITIVRYKAMLISGALASLGGMYLSMGYVNRFTSGMTAGRGYIALATNAMAAGSAMMGLFSSALYGFGSGLSIYMQTNNVDTRLVTMIPYAFIIIFYTGFCYYYKQKKKSENININ